MENDQLLAADPNVRPVAGRVRSDHADSRGYDAVMRTQGGIAAYKNVDYEDTPLLSRGIDDDFERPEQNAPGEGDNGEPEWSGAKDFEGQPWWNRPSVRRHPAAGGVAWSQAIY